ncbi:MAG: DUF3833 family protein [Gammaproteobacteria bacterium]
MNMSFRANARNPAFPDLARIIPIGLCLLLVSCGGMEPRDFANATPRFHPEKFFSGSTHSWGVIEDRSANPTSRFRTETHGRRDRGALLIDQRFYFEDGRTQRRTWRLRRIDAHHYEATANDVVGVATGEAHGNAFRWEYTLRLNANNPLSNVRLKHWMYLLDGGVTMLNRVTVSKLGFIVAEVTEYCRRGARPVPAISLRRGAIAAGVRR